VYQSYKTWGCRRCDGGLAVGGLCVYNGVLAGAWASSDVYNVAFREKRVIT